MKILKVIVVLLAVMLFVQAGSHITRAQDQVTLTWWWWGTGDIPTMRDWVDWVAQAYQEQHPNVTIVTEERLDSDIFTAFEAAAAARSGPDIAPQWAGGLVLTQVWAGNLAPISDYVDAEEISNWLNVAENEFEGKYWAVPIYIVGEPLVYNKALFAQVGLDPEVPFATWDDLLTACDTLRAAGITPIVGGNRLGYEGSWMFAQFAKQYMDSPDDLKALILGHKDWKDIEGWAVRLQETIDHQCWNEDVSSLELQEKYNVFNDGQAAMVYSIDGAILQSAEILGAENIGITKTPVFGDGAMADWYTATQSISHFITEWSPNKELAADFMTFWHSPEALQQWFDLTGTTPADKRFDVSTVEDPIRQRMFSLNQQPGVWLSNFEPGQVYEQADLSANQLLFSGTGTVADVTAQWEEASRRWREQSPEAAANFERWIAKTR